MCAHYDRSKKKEKDKYKAVRHSLQPSPKWTMYWPPRLLSRCAHLAAVLSNEYSCHVAESKQTDRRVHGWHKKTRKLVASTSSATYSSQVPDAEETGLSANNEACTLIGQAHWPNVVISWLQAETMPQISCSGFKRADPVLWNCRNIVYHAWKIWAKVFIRKF